VKGRGNEKGAGVSRSDDGKRSRGGEEKTRKIIRFGMKKERFTQKRKKKTKPGRKATQVTYRGFMA